ncbi:autotransporter domain-containing protein [Paraburkholderia phymatum]|uniref:Autotransporter domain-containing protein n=1 Tax=Paraburkholderia phymatum TaxID=148447 RepID=A0ACC6U097_9BURK
MPLLLLWRAVSSALSFVCALRYDAAFAACDNTAPASGETATCSSASPNPSTTPVVALPGSVNVTVSVQAGVELDVSTGNAVLVRDASTVTNLGTLNVLANDFDGISAQGMGAGRNVLVNRGMISTISPLSEGMFNSAAAVTMLNETTGVIHTGGSNAVGMHDFLSPGGGTLTNNGQVSTTGDGSYGMAALTHGDTLTNNGTLATSGPNAHGIFANGGAVGSPGNNTITNSGTITVSGANAHGIVSLDSAPGVITNRGSITASGGGGLGAFVVGSVTFDNEAGASVISRQANGIIANGGGTLTNAGTIAALSDGITLGGAATVTNTGSIASTASAAILSHGSGAITIVNAGSLSGLRAVATDAGNDVFTMTAGSTTGAVDLGDGDNAATISGGAVGQGITTGGGADTFVWSGGTIAGAVTLGAGNDTATLQGVADSNLAKLASLDGGQGNDVLTLSNSRLGGWSRFGHWETVNLTNASQLTLDKSGLTLGDSGTATGMLNIDSTSTLFAGGLGDPPISPVVAGQLVTVNNAGTIDLTNGGSSTSDTLVINGNYAGMKGRLLLQSLLGSDGSPADRLVISQGAATGSTTIGVTNVGGGGGVTNANGILLVQAINGGTTAASSFTLSSPLMAGAYVYYLFKGGVDAGTADNWYLRSSLAAPAPIPAPSPTPTPQPSPPQPAPMPAVGTPPLPPPPPPGSPPIPLYRMEAPVYAAVPVVARALGVEQMGTFHERQGAQMLLNETGRLPAAWVRAWGEHAEATSGGTLEPAFSGTMGGVQAGHDLYADGTPNGHRNHYGVFFSFVRATGDVNGFALGFPDFAAGHLSINSTGAGAYWTHIGPGGWYTDAVIVGSSLSVSPSSNEGISASTNGYEIGASIEGGFPVPLSASLSVEPQIQLIVQHLGIDDLSDGVSNVSFHAANSVVGRIGARVQGQFEQGGAAFQPFATANLWRNFGGTDYATLGPTALSVSDAATALQFDIGVVAKASRRASAFARVAYTMNVNGSHRSVVGGNVGVRWSW